MEQFFQSFVNGGAPQMRMMQPRQQRFERLFKAMPMSYASGKNDTRDADAGNQILMPPSALEELSHMNIQFPMQFNITNHRSQRSSHCGVLEFTAPEGVVYLPLSMMHNLGLDVQNHQYVKLKNVSLPKGTFAVFQPYKMAFVTDLPNHRIILEKTLREYACITKGDIIEIKFAGKHYDLEVISVKPANAVSIRETDLSVEFAPPKDEKQYQHNLSAQQPMVEAGAESSSDEDDFNDRRTVRNVVSRQTPIAAERLSGYRLKDSKEIIPAVESSNTEATFHNEEEIVGKYRYIYKVNDNTGERECIRRFPVRNNNSNFSGSGHRLK